MSEVLLRQSSLNTKSLLETLLETLVDLRVSLLRNLLCESIVLLRVELRLACVAGHHLLLGKVLEAYLLVWIEHLLGSWLLVGLALEAKATILRLETSLLRGVSESRSHRHCWI